MMRLPVIVVIAFAVFCPAARSAPATNAATLYQRCKVFMAQPDPGTRAMTSCQRAISADPTQASAKLLGDECLLFYKEMKVDQAIPECDLAIAAEPDRADLYFVKGAVLFVDSTMNDGKLIVPPAAVAALKKYLALAPNGDHADYVRAMLTTVL